VYVREHSFFTAGSSSQTTSGAYFTGDFQSYSVEIGAASAVTLQGSNADGFTTALAEADWSTLSVIAAAGIQKVETGFRWARAIRTSSANTVRSFGQSRD
jgi:hypothetical protein